MTIDNQSGKSFENARVKLMAGDVSKIQRDEQMRTRAAALSAVAEGAGPPVTEKSFDEYHLYTLQRPMTLRDRETKQVEFVRASGVNSERLYVYDGASIDWGRWRGYDPDVLRQNESLGAESNPKVWVMREFKNSKENGLGIALPKGRVRFYQRDEDGQLEFVGENNIDHTPERRDSSHLRGQRFRHRRRTQADRVQGGQLKLLGRRIVRNHPSQPKEGGR